MTSDWVGGGPGPTRAQEREEARWDELWGRYVNAPFGPLSDIRAALTLLDVRLRDPDYGSRLRDALGETIGMLCSALEDGGMPPGMIHEAQALLEGWSSLEAKIKAEKEQGK